MTLSKIARFSCVVCALVFVALPATLRGDLDKEELKKKQEAEARPSLGDQEGDDFYKNLAREGEKNLREINELIEKIQGDLANKSTGGETQKMQQQAVQKLEQLIREIAKASQQQSSSSSSQQQQQQKQQQQQQKEQQQRQQQKKMDSQRMEPDEQKQQQSEKERNDEQNRKHERVEKPAVPDGQKGSLLARLRQNRRWGLLPRKVTEALSSSDKEAPAEYREIIVRYYKKMSDYYDRKK